MNIINTKRAGKIAGVNPSTIGRWCQDGLINAKKIDNAWAINEDSLRAYIESYERKPPAKPTAQQRKGNMRVILDQPTVKQETIEANRQKIIELQQKAKAGKVQPIVLAAGVYSLKDVKNG